jgi:hypothetical protein
MGDNDQGFYKRDVVEKPIDRVVVSCTDMPAGLLSMSPLYKTPTIPTGTTPTPPVSKLVSAALPGIGPAARNVRDMIARKTGIS